MARQKVTNTNKEKNKTKTKGKAIATKSVAEILAAANTSPLLTDLGVLVSQSPEAEAEAVDAEIKASPDFTPRLLATENEFPLIVHQQVMLLEFSQPNLLVEVLHTTDLAHYIVRQLSETVVMVDQAKEQDFVKFLTKKGYEPKIIRL